MKTYIKYFILIAVTITAIIVVSQVKRVPQDQAFHHFADRRTIFGVPNGLNVLSNFPFLVVAIIGFYLLRRSTAASNLKLIYAVIFSGIALTAFGSAYYHFSPDNDRLVFDRIPMTVVFMGFMSAVIARLVDMKTGTILLFPLLAAGIMSVLWWHYTEGQNAGDLRYYGLVQYYPMILIFLIIVLFPSPGNKRFVQLLVWVIVWYVVAKICEHFDKEIYSALGFISGHSLKHLAACLATWYIVKLLLLHRNYSDQVLVD